MRPKSQWPLPGGWIDRSTEQVLRVTIVERSYCDLGISERASAPNRSGRIDAYLKRAGVSDDIIASGRGYWCASWAGAVWDDAGAAVPPAYYNCDSWVAWGKKFALWKTTPVIGAAVLYGIPGDATHIGIVVRIPKPDYPYLYSIEGNTSINGYSGNGLLCGFKEVNRPRVLGYVWPVLASS